MRKLMKTLVLLLGVLLLPTLAHAVCTQETGGVLTSILTWANTDSTDPVGILRSTVSGGPYTQIATVNAGVTTYTDQPITPPVTYYYVTQNQSVANGNSVNSNEVCKIFFAPAPPINVLAAAVTPSQITVSWTTPANSGGVGLYLLERSDGTGSFSQITGVSGTTLTDSALDPTVTHSYRLRSQDAAGQILSGYSNVATPPPPPAPTNLTAIGTSPTQITLSWSASLDNLGVTAYLVEQCPGLGCSTFVQIDTTASTSVVSGGLLPSTTYSYRIRAQDTPGTRGAYSSTAVGLTAPSLIQGTVLF
jgi:hypothetical protein